MKNSILTKTLLFTKNKNLYTSEERATIRKGLLNEAESILVRIIDKVNID